MGKVGEAGQPKLETARPLLLFLLTHLSETTSTTNMTNLLVEARGKILLCGLLIVYYYGTSYKR